MRPVDLPAAKGDTGGAKKPAAGLEDPAEGDGAGHAGAEDEDLGRVGKAEARRDPKGPGIARDMGDQDDEHRQPAEDIEPRVAHCRRDSAGMRTEARARMPGHQGHSA